MNKKLLALSTMILMTLTLVMVPGLGLLPPIPPIEIEPEIAVKIEGDWLHTLPPSVPMRTWGAVAPGPIDPGPPIIGWDYCMNIPPAGPITWPGPETRLFEPYELEAPAFSTTFEVEIWLLNVTDLYAYEFRLVWNYGWLDLESYTLIDLDEGMGEQHVIDIDPVTPGMQPVFVQVWTHLGAVDGFTGSAPVASLVFHVHQDPTWPDTFYSAIYILSAEASGPTTDDIPLSREHGMVLIESVQPGAFLTPEDLVIVSEQDKQITVGVNVKDVIKMKSFDLTLRWCRTCLDTTDMTWDAIWIYYALPPPPFAGPPPAQLFVTNDEANLYLGLIAGDAANPVGPATPITIGIDTDLDGVIDYEARINQAGVVNTFVRVRDLAAAAWVTGQIGSEWEAPAGVTQFMEVTIPFAVLLDLSLVPPAPIEYCYQIGLAVEVPAGVRIGACEAHMKEQLELDLQKHPIVVTDFLPGPYVEYDVEVLDKRVDVDVERDCEKPAINGTGTIVEVTLTALSPWGYKVCNIPELCYEKERKKVPPYFYYDECEKIHLWMPEECVCFITGTLRIDTIRCRQPLNEEAHAPGPYMGDYIASPLAIGSSWVQIFPWFQTLTVGPILYDFRPISGDFDMSGHVGLEDLMAIAEWYGYPVALIGALIEAGVPPAAAPGLAATYWAICISDFDIVTSPESVGEIDIFDLTAVAKQFCEDEPFYWPWEEPYLDP